MHRPITEEKRNRWKTFLEENDPLHRKTQILRVCSCHVIDDMIDFSTNDYKKVITGLIANMKKDEEEKQVYLDKEEQLKIVFNQDQLQVLFNTNSSFKPMWSEDTVFKSLMMLSKLTKNSYEMLRTLFKWPIPTETTIRRRIKDVKFLPGLVEEVIAGLEKKGKSADDDLDLMLVVDETSIARRSEIGHDCVLGVPSEELNQTGEPQTADKILVILLRSLRNRNRQIVGYFYTKNINGAQLFNLLKDVIMKIETRSRYKIHGISSDMGSNNRGAWEKFGISVKSDGIRRVIGQHPLHTADNPRVFFWFPDSSHLLKNIRNFMITHSFVLPNPLRIQRGLKDLPLASLAPFEDIIKIREKDGPDFQPKIREDVIKPSGFNKMNVGYAVRLFSRDSVEALKQLKDFAIHKEFDISSSQSVIESTLCFVEIVTEWFELVSCTDYDSDYAIEVSGNVDWQSKLTLMSNIFGCIGFVNGIRSVELSKTEKVENTFKPFSTGIIQLNETIVEFMTCLKSFKNPISKFTLGTLSSDQIESLFGELKAKYRVPGPRDMSFAIRSTALSPISYNSMKSNVHVSPLTSILTPQEIVQAAKSVKRKPDRTPSIKISDVTERDEIEVERMMRNSDQFKIRCSSCEAFIFTDDNFKSFVVTKAEGLLRCNISEIYNPGCSIKLFIEEVVKTLDLNDPQIMRSFPCCCGSSTISLFLKQYLDLRINAIVSNHNSGREHRFDSHTPL